MIADVILSGESLALCAVWAIVVGLILGGIAWVIPPSRRYAVAIGLVAAGLVILSCLI